MSTAQTFTKDDIKGYECKHATYTLHQNNDQDDLLTIKEQIHLKDGRIIPNVRLKVNYEREFHVTREGQRNHKEKKEWEKLSKVQVFKTTQRKMLKRIAQALGRGTIQGGLRTAARSPYLYSTDITTPVLVKEHYQRTFPDCITDNTVAVCDIESDVVNGTEMPIMVSLTFRSKAVICIVESFLKGLHDPSTKIKESFTKYLGEYQTSRNIDLEIVIAKTPGEAIVECFKRAHVWMPDIITIWNINYDMPKMVHALELENINPADVFSDPKVPHQFRYFRYKQGPAQKITASGKTMSLAPAEQWHVVECPASFYFLDAMCVYLKIRIAKGKEASYRLDYILEKHLGIRKLKFEEANHLGGLGWHRFMQVHHRIEYCVYNLFDCISVELLDEKTTDLCRTASLLCGFSEYSKFGSQPRRTCDDLHFFMQQYGMVIASTSDQMETELDKDVIGIRDWIVTLPAYMVEDNGLMVSSDCPNIRSNMYGQVAD